MYAQMLLSISFFRLADYSSSTAVAVKVDLHARIRRTPESCGCMWSRQYHFYHFRQLTEAIRDLR